MKRHGNLWSKIVDIDNIKSAHKNARKGKKHYSEVKMVDTDIDVYCLEIKRLLESKEYTTSAYTKFIKNDKGKEREIFKLPYYPDRIIQHALMQIVEPIWKGTLIADTYQSIKGRGIHKCLPKVKRAVQVDRVKYYMQLDVKKFYPSIDHDMLKSVVRHKIKCKDTLWLVDDIIDSSEGIPIGNYVSQYLGNLQLSKLDHLMKEALGVKHYYRYCDDILLLCNSKEVLHKLKSIITDELIKIKLELKYNHKISTVTKGIDFLGYVIYVRKLLLRKSIKNRLVRLYSDKSAPSYNGWLVHCDGHNLLNTTKEGIT